MKRLICSFDGTWDEPTDTRTLTNVVKLHNAIPPRGPDGVAQNARYEIGIATDSTGVRSFVLGAIGHDVASRVQSAFRYLCEAYEPGDEIYLFGFSRGAFEARSLLGLISLAGLPRRDALDQLDTAWTCYKARQREASLRDIEETRSRAHYPVRIKCIGVWDTVGNLGIPFVSFSGLNRGLAFHDTRLTALVDVALQALAIDEPRGPFAPTLWTAPEDYIAPPRQIVEQVWFPGSHANVGGGLEDSGLSDIALLWMAERAGATTGLAIDIGALRERAAPDALATQYVPTTGLYRTSGWCPFIRLIRQDMRAVPPLRRSLTGGWRTSRLPAGERSLNEVVHPAARLRFGNAVRMMRGAELAEAPYRPRNLAVVLEPAPEPDVSAASRRLANAVSYPKIRRRPPAEALGSRLRSRVPKS